MKTTNQEGSQNKKWKKKSQAGNFQLINLFYFDFTGKLGRKNKPR